MAQFVFSDAAALARTVLIGIAAYAALIAILRVSGKRTLSKMNAFDFVVTVALGSTLATILVDTSVTLAQGALALALLVALQFAITWTSVRVAWVRRIVAASLQGSLPFLPATAAVYRTTGRVAPRTRHRGGSAGRGARRWPRRAEQSRSRGA